MMFVAPIKSIYSDLTFPSHNDGWYGVSLPTQIRLYEVAYARYKNPPIAEYSTGLLSAGRQTFRRKRF